MRDSTALFILQLAAFVGGIAGIVMGAVLRTLPPLESNSLLPFFLGAIISAATTLLAWWLL